MKTWEFEVDGVKYKIDKPTLKDRQDAKLQYQTAFSAALRGGAWFRSSSMKVAREQGLWSDEDDANAQLYEKQISELVNKLDEGGYELDEAIKDAKEIQRLRLELLKLNYKLAPIISQSAENQAETMESDYLLFVCLKDNKGRRYCSSFDDFLNKKEDGDDVIDNAYMGHVLDTGSWDQLPESQFLQEYDPPSEEKAKEPVKKEKKPFTKNGKAVKPVSSK